MHPQWKSALAMGRTAPRVDPITKAKQNPTSCRKAITAKCWECMGEGADPGCKQAIRDCTSPNCPLYQLRPYQQVK